MATEQRCGTCRHYRKRPRRCDYPIPLPQWVTSMLSHVEEDGLRWNDLDAVRDGTDCPCYQPAPQPETEETTDAD